MFLNSSDRAFISDLKSKIVKILTFKNRLQKVERKDLEEIYILIDDLILNKDSEEGVALFKDKMSAYSSRVRFYQKPFIKEQIAPLIQKSCERLWGKKKRGRKKSE